MNNTYGTPADGYPAGAATPTRRKRWYRWGVGAALVGFLAGGGITLAAVSGVFGGSGGGVVPAGPTGSAGSASGAQGAALNTALNAASGASSSTVSPARLRWALGRLRRLGGVEGTVTFHNKTGFHTLSFERGTIASVSGSDVVISSPDGTTWTWQIVSDTVVRKNSAKTTTGALSAGETVFVGGPVIGGARDARLIVIRPAASGSTGSSGSQSAQTSLS